MPSRFADDDAAKGPEREERAEPQAQPETEQPVAEQAATTNQVPSERELWTEPKVPAQQILIAIYKTGGKSEPELEEILNRSGSTMGWADYWARQGFLKAVVRGSERRYELSKRALLELELEVA